jgi:hypothetical protein
MATLNLTTGEFADVAIIWLLDQMTNPEQITNPKFLEFVKGNKDMKADLLSYYFGTSSMDRLNYRRISGIFNGSTNSIQQIRIGPEEKIEDEKKKDSKLKKFAKGVIKKLMKKEELNLEEKKYLQEMLEYVIEE